MAFTSFDERSLDAGCFFSSFFGASFR